MFSQSLEVLSDFPWLSVPSIEWNSSKVDAYYRLITPGGGKGRFTVAQINN